MKHRQWLLILKNGPGLWCRKNQPSAQNPPNPKLVKKEREGKGSFSAAPEDIIHTVGPIAQGEPSAAQEAELSSCYTNSLKLAVENKLRTVAFPCISTGVFGYPNEAAAEVVLHTLHNWLEDNKEKVDRIIICVFLETDEMIYKEKLPRFFPVDALGGPHSQL
ncbi:PREDICTED: O-acetyl-ADP-ribose deacetylase MACROD1-like [Gekko japonicus]|uniref:O-acetyl-ADP-ribose deacetylase MACROD1-like n=1 Tax=Gekko japonicus TaxID=146911 RepID=A0ABM1KQP5_GEKJA|nr:PREDICTED: O-acetyl-ADP-ribose deacetylase MACROD1-like [Gekko japonicus]